MSEIPTADWTWIDVGRDPLRTEWKKGNRPRIEEFLAEVDKSRWPQLVEELLRVERELLERAGAEPEIEEYRRRFPDNDAVIDAVFSLDAGRVCGNESHDIHDPTRRPQGRSHRAEIPTAIGSQHPVRALATSAITS